MSIKNKNFRFVIIDPEFYARLLICAVFLIVIFTQSKYALAKTRELKQTEKNSSLVSKLDEMKERLVSKLDKMKEKLPPKPSILPEPDNAQLILQGTQVEEGISYALINSKIYKEGDFIGNYLVTKVGNGMVSLENKTNKAIVNLYLYSRDFVK